VRAILKALWLTIWGLIAIGLLATFLFVGYQAAIRHRASSGIIADEGTSIDRAEPGKFGPFRRNCLFGASESNKRYTVHFGFGASPHAYGDPQATGGGPSTTANINRRLLTDTSSPMRTPQGPTTF
jgi:hypothetical protein